MPKNQQKPEEHICSSCTKPAVTYIRYSGAHLCANHFSEFLKTRVKREMRKQGKLPPDSRLAVALSGGKDSLTLLHLMVEMFANHKDLELVALSVDEGIEPYRTDSLAIASRWCKKLGVEHRVISFKKKFGYTLDEIARADIPDLLPCSYCGVFRRSCLNVLSREISATKLATGHNLDDNSQSILMNICKGDFNKLFRLGPHRIIKEGLIPRIMPLRVIPEKEIYLHTILNHIDAYTGECPYAQFAQRGLYRKILNQLEDQQPGTRHAIINIYDHLFDNIEANIKTGPMNTCSTCGEPSSGLLCKACEMQKIIESAI
ncbi:MAG: TIGR00269 family protein [Thermoplasmata archaeon]|nr:MAG: TIGR00269 family protein [Thermoplasmata archaeon]